MKDFLDFLTDPFYDHSDQTETTSRRLNYMIATALITSEERNKYEMESYKLSEFEATELIEKLKSYMPQVGYHTIPQSVEEQGRAIRYAVDKDTFYNDERNGNI